MLCRHCGADFKPKRKDAEYCSDKCRAAAYQARTKRTHIKNGDSLTINGKTFYLYRDKR